MRWLRKNCICLLFIAGVFIAGAVVGATIVAIASQTSVEASESDFQNESYELPKAASGDTLIISTNFQTSTPVPEEIVWEEYIATAYCSCEKCCGIYAKDRPVDENGKEIVYTASGERAEQGVTIAADWSVLPAGTIVEVDGYGEFVVHDKGGAIKGNKIDIYFESHQEALEWGVKNVKLRIVETGGEEK